MANGNGEQTAVVEEKSAARRVADPELVAMHDILTAISDLDLESQSRVLSFVRGRVEDSIDARRPREPEEIAIR